MKRILLIIAGLTLLLADPSAAQRTKDPGFWHDKFQVRTAGSSSAADSSFAVNATANVTSEVYRAWPNMSLKYKVASSGTVDIDVLFQTAAAAENQGAGDVLKWTTAKTTDVTATGDGDIIVTEGPIPNHLYWRVVADGQGSNDASTTITFVFTGINVYKAQ